MIIFGECYDEPFNKLKYLYDKAVISQNNIEAMSLSSVNQDYLKPYSRFVNIKYIQNDELIFFSNYTSNKARQFESSNCVAGLFFWASIRTQIRIEGTIEKSTNEISDKHFKLRSSEKNALAISSNQSSRINSFDLVEKNYIQTLANADLMNRPEYWGGYTISPTYFEFWKGSKNRLNKREEYKLDNGIWKYSVLEP